MATVYHAMSDGTFLETKCNLRKGIRSLVFLAVVLTVEAMEES